MCPNSGANWPVGDDFKAPVASSCLWGARCVPVSLIAREPPSWGAGLSTGWISWIGRLAALRSQLTALEPEEGPAIQQLALFETRRPPPGIPGTY